MGTMIPCYAAPPCCVRPRMHLTSDKGCMLRKPAGRPIMGGCQGKENMALQQCMHVLGACMCHMRCVTSVHCYGNGKWQVCLVPLRCFSKDPGLELCPLSSALMDVANGRSGSTASARTKGYAPAHQFTVHASVLRAALVFLGCPAPLADRHGCRVRERPPSHVYTLMTTKHVLRALASIQSTVSTSDAYRCSDQRKAFALISSSRPLC
jgi:hypothetical protein